MTELCGADADKGVYNVLCGLALGRQPQGSLWMRCIDNFWEMPFPSGQGLGGSDLGLPSISLEAKRSMQRGHIIYREGHQMAYNKEFMKALNI